MTDMKRFIAILLAAVIFSASAAQAQIIHVKSTTIERTKREKPQRERTGPPLKLNYRGFVEADFAYCIDDSYKNGFGITATYGCQLNDFLFIGAGTGIRMDRYSLYGRDPQPLWGIPLYADLKCYFKRNARIKPFAEISVGGEIGFKRDCYMRYHYHDEGFHYEMCLDGFRGWLSIGLECKNLFLKAGIGYGESYNNFQPDDEWFPIQLGIGYSF